MAGGYAVAYACYPEKLGDAYDKAMKEYVFDPLQMQKTAIKIEEALQLGAAMPHATDFNGRRCKISPDLEKFAYCMVSCGCCVVNSQ